MDLITTCLLQKFNEIESKKDVEPYTFIGDFLAKVIYVYDGDTCTVVTDQNVNINCFPNLPKFISENSDLILSLIQLKRYNVRLLGYNAEEIRQPKNLENREELKKLAIDQRNYLREKIMGKIVLLKAEGLDKYGRILANIYEWNGKIGGCVNDYMKLKI